MRAVGRTGGGSMMTTATATSAIERFVGGAGARTLQRVIVRATPGDVYDAIWTANLLSSPLARTLSAVAMWPTRVLAWLRHTPQPPPGSRSATLADMLVGDSPWIKLIEVPGAVVVLGLLWKPPADGESCIPGAFATFAEPGFAKVVWALSVEPFGASHSLLVSETRTHTTDAVAARRFRLLWPVISPFAGILRMQVLRAIKAEAEAR
jgi:hypothetical protein